MKTAQEDRYAILQRALLAMVGILMAAVLVLAAASRNIIVQNRGEGDYAAVENVTVTEADEDGRYECRFTLGRIDHAETLGFFVNHQEVQVCIGEETVYTMAAEEDIFATCGGAWVMIPLYESDGGKEVRVLLTPLYDDYRNRSGAPEFLVGAEIAVHNVTLHRAMPALVLSLCVMFTGILLLCLALYHSAKGMATGRLCALGLMAVSAGLWRISYDRVAYMLFSDHAVLIYTLSLVSLMVVALSMLNSLETDAKGRKAIRLCSCGYCAIYLFQLLLQLAGVADLRQTLKAVHVTIVISAVAFVIASVRRLLRPSPRREGRGDFGWILGLGVVIDLLLYYFAETTFNMVFTLVAILCYSILEGIRLLMHYMRQKNALEEMEVQLTLSRTTTMMS